ncbi:hypothetical protein PUF88_00575 [Lactobacillaceae bacterium L1_55_11]|nr:hypothetical protein [Lactobacillaceae bacterium L1_55_11]
MLNLIFKILLGVLAVFGFLVLIFLGRGYHWAGWVELLSLLGWLVLINLAYIYLYVRQTRSQLAQEVENEGDGKAE